MSLVAPGGSSLTQLVFVMSLSPKNFHPKPRKASKFPRILQGISAITQKHG